MSESHEKNSLDWLIPLIICVWVGVCLFIFRHSCHDAGWCPKVCYTTDDETLNKLEQTDIEAAKN